MAMKCVAQIPQPVAAPASISQAWRARPLAARARRNELTATRLASRQTRPASTTSRQSCSFVRQEKTRNIEQLDLLFTKTSGSQVYFALGARGQVEPTCARVRRQHLDL